MITTVLVSALWLEVATADPNVSIRTDIVQASTTRGTIDRSLVKMKEALASRVNYQTLQIVKTATVALSNQSTSVSLPNNKVAELVLISMKDNVATVKVKEPPAEPIYTLGRDKALYIQAGEFEGRELWLVLSQPSR